jgi:hypothetical protein
LSTPQQQHRMLSCRVTIALLAVCNLVLQGFSSLLKRDGCCRPQIPELYFQPART